MEPIYLNTPEYIVELWDINGVFVADITALISSSLRISMPLNDVDEVSFSLDLVQFELYCQSINARPINLLEPYRTDVKIRRNGQYMVGAQVVQTSVNFNNEATNKIEVQCTGYLNYLKDRYVSAHYANMTYAQIARDLITQTQSAANLITNGDFHEGLNGWQYIDAGYVVWSATEGKALPGSLFASVSTGSAGFGGARWSHSMQAGLIYTLSYWIKPVTGTGSTYIVTQTGVAMNTVAVTNTAGWTNITHTWTQPVNSSYVDIKMNNNTNFFLDDVKLSDNVDSATVRNFGITLGTDTASATQAATRIRNYDLQNVKDGIINLTKLEADNFDFSFDANKVFTTYARKGSDKADVELVYPQNIKSIATARSAQTLANKVIALGSGIGDERIQTSVFDLPSATSYRVRESTEMFNSVINLPVLAENALGVLDQRESLNDTIEVKVNANVLDLDNVQTGDAIYVRIDQPEGEVKETEANIVTNDNFVTDTTGYYPTGYRLDYTGSASYTTATSNVDAAHADGVSCEFLCSFDTLNNGVISRFLNAGSNDSLRMNIESTGKLFVWIVNAAGAGSLAVKPDTVLVVKRMYHIVYTYVKLTATTSRVRIYIDGTLIGETTTAAVARTTDTTMIGSTGTSLDGQVKLARFYQKELTPSEVTSLHTGSALPTDGLKVEWLYEEGAGTGLNDSSGNKNHGLVTNASWLSDLPTLEREDSTSTDNKYSMNIGRNLIENGGFSLQPATSVPQTTSNGNYINGTNGGTSTNPGYGGWRPYGSNQWSAEFDKSDTVRPSSLRLETRASGSYVETRSNAANGYFGTYGFPVKPNTKYRFSYWQKTQHISGDATTGAYGTVLISNAAGAGATGNTGTMSGTTVKTTQDWTLRTMEFTTGSDAAWAHVELRIYGHNGAATLVMKSWFDDVTVREVDLPTNSGAKYTLSGLQVGQTYNVSAYVKSEVGDYAGLLIPGIGQSSALGTGYWRYVTVPFKATETTKDIYFMNYSNGNRFYIDNIQVPYTKREVITRPSFVDYVNGLYRITKIDIDVSQEFEEDISLRLEKWE